VTSHSSQIKSCVTDKHNTKYNTLISEQPYIHSRWSIFTFPGQNEPRPGHGTPWVNSGTIPAISGTVGNPKSMGASRLWWKKFVEKVSFEPGMISEYVMEGESGDNE